MNEVLLNPIHLDPAITTGRTVVQSGTLGQRLSVYATARARAELADPLIALGLPLLDELLAQAGEPAVHVTAICANGGTSRESWSLILTFASGLNASIDIAAGLGVAQEDDLDVRFEWSGTDQAVLIEPARPAVTVINGTGSRRHSVAVTPLDAAVFAFADAASGIFASPASEWAPAAAVIAAARASAETGTRQTIASGG